MTDLFSSLDPTCPKHGRNLRLDGGSCMFCKAPESPSVAPVTEVGLRDPEARQARDEALERVERGAGDDWKVKALAAVREVAGRCDYEEVSDDTWVAPRPFTTDDVWELLDAPPEPRALGAVMMTLARAGEIEKTGDYKQSTRKECHCRPIPYWRKA